VAVAPHGARDVAVPEVRDEPVEGLAQRRLARTVAAAVGDEVSPLDAQVDSAQGLAGAARVAASQVADLDGRCRLPVHRCPSPSRALRRRRLLATASTVLTPRATP